MATISKQDIHGALARAYQYPGNRKKELDSRLLEAAAAEVLALLDKCADINATEMSPEDQQNRAVAYSIAAQHPNAAWGFDVVHAFAKDIFDNIKFGFKDKIVEKAKAAHDEIASLLDPVELRREGWNDAKAVMIRTLSKQINEYKRGERRDVYTLGHEHFGWKALEKVREFVASFAFDPTKP